ncbi:MAG: DUF3160 domain-containing protein [Ignavibacteriales bacterium]|nr:DUF3160 domain-containing protein [Ignavibacteriales bacterium]
MKTLIFTILLIFTLPLHSQNPNFTLQSYIEFLQSHQNLSSAQILEMYPTGEFNSGVTPFAGNILYHDSISTKYNLTEYERSLINQHGFMVSERLSYPTFLSATSDIFHKDLPLFVSTDAILHALHLSYDKILMQLEGEYLIPKLQLLLNSIHSQISGLNTLYGSDSLGGVALRDLDVYNTVARKLFNPAATPWYSSNNLKIDSILQFIDDETMVFYSLFGEQEHYIDFSQFTLRGHYADEQNLMNYPLLDEYFKAMIWLGRTEIQLLPPGETFQRDPSTARGCMFAAFLEEATSSTPAIGYYSEINELLNFLVGTQDNVTINNLTYLLENANITSPLQFNDTTKLYAFQDSLLANPFAFQRINSQLLLTNPFSPTTTHPASAVMLMGQRFVIDSYITSQVVFDRIIYNGRKIKRMLPNTLDVLGGLGNNAAIRLLKDELNGYHYGTNLAAARYLIEAYDTSFWNANLFHRWVNSLRKINPPEDRDSLPQFMQTAAFWQQKLNTQLGSWTQLRHDNILYAKQSYTSGWVCSFPYGYVEPFPSFYEDLRDFGDFFKTILVPLQFNNQYIKMEMMNWCDRFRSSNDTLASISKKELANQNLSGQEQQFLRNFLKVDHSAYGSPYDGWYYHLFYAPEDLFQKQLYVVADIHTSGQDENGNYVGWVKHVGTGNVNLGVVTAKNPAGVDVAYVGPFLSYYDYTTTNMLRLDDDSWINTYLAQASRPDFVNLYLADSLGNSRGTGSSLLTSVRLENRGDDGIIEDFRLAQNYPNPFNNSTIIKFSIPSSATGNFVELNIFNVQGILVMKLIAEPLQQGNYSIAWNGDDNSGTVVASGIYFYSLNSGGKTFTGKMTLLK